MIRIGTSGWVYDDWKGRFYPADVGSEAMLPFYAQTFDTVEVNNTFYQLPSADSVDGWRERSPEGFLFAVKMNRYVTHRKNLLEPEEPVARFLDRVGRLDRKLGPVLVQLPPHWHVNVERLRSFITLLPQDRRYAFEFRHRSWYINEVYEALETGECAFCLHDHEDAPSPTEITADFIYVRFHGTEGGYHGEYAEEALAEWARKFAGWEEEGLDVYAYFNNDWQAHAVENGKRLRRLLETT